MKKRATKNVLRPDTTFAPANDSVVGAEEVYAHQLPVCCVRSLKAAVMARPGEERLKVLDCGCGRGWRVVASLDGRVLGRFVEQGRGWGAGSGYGPPAA